MSSIYKLFKNLLHNELHITKDDIQAMIREEVKKQVEAICEGRNGSRLENMAREEIRDRVRFRIGQDMIKEVTKKVADNVKINITCEPDENGNKL